MIFTIECDCDRKYALKITEERSQDVKGYSE